MKFALLFPGYGSQFVGMGKELYDSERLMQEYFEEAATCLNINFVKLCFASSEAELARPAHAYTALFLVGASSSGLLKEHALSPSFVSGVDVPSWYSSLYAAGCIRLPDGLYILNKLGTAYEEIINQNRYSALLIKGSTKRKVEILCKEASQVEQYVGISAITPQGFVVTGHNAAVENLETLVNEKPDMTFEAVDIAGGLHTSAAEEIALQVNNYFEKIDFKEPKCAIISPIDGKIIETAEEVKHISTIISVQQLDQLAVFKKLLLQDRVCIAVPSEKIKHALADAGLNSASDTLENPEELKALLTLYKADEELSHVE